MTDEPRHPPNPGLPPDVFEAPAHAADAYRRRAFQEGDDGG